MKDWRHIVREVYPDCRLLDAALVYPRTDSGWNVETVHPDSITDDKLIINMQDHLTASPEFEFPVELEKLWIYLNTFDTVNFDNIIAIVECPVPDWPRDRFRVISWSSFLYDDWCANKRAEPRLRSEFADAHRSLRYYTVCPMRHNRPHRELLYNRLNPKFNNCSLQSKGYELQYDNLTFDQYEHCYDNLANLFSNKKNYLTAGFVTVAESQYSVTHGVITEKTMHAIIAGMPFFVLGHRGILSEIKQLGFRTFEGIVDENYDSQDDVQRLDEMLTSNRNIFEGFMNKSILKQIIENTREITEYNRQYYFDSFGDYLIDSLRRQLLETWS